MQQPPFIEKAFFELLAIRRRERGRHFEALDRHGLTQTEVISFVDKAETTFADDSVDAILGVEGSTTPAERVAHAQQ